MGCMQKVTMYGAPWCVDCRRSKKFLGEQRIHYEWIDIEENAEAAAVVEKINDGKRIIPVIVFEDGSALVEPSNAELAEKLHLQTRARMSYYDLIVIGSGPAGLTTALYAAREGLETLVIEKGGIGGNAGSTEQLDNFPGFPEGVTGSEFANRLLQQAQRFGVEVLQAQAVTGLRAEAESRYITTKDGSEYGARAVLITSGSTYKKLGVPGEQEFIGAGVHFCATCDGPFYKGEPMAVVGGGNSAAEESLFLTRFASKVTMLVRGNALRASKLVVDKLMENRQLDVRFNTEVQELRGSMAANGKHNKLSEITVRNNQTGVAEVMPVRALFEFIGLKPNTQWLPPEVTLDEFGFVLTDHELSTSMPGVFAAGDVRKGSTKQAASAAGEGATAALMIREYFKTR